MPVRLSDPSPRIRLIDVCRGGNDPLLGAERDCGVAGNLVGLGGGRTRAGGPVQGERAAGTGRWRNTPPLP